MKWFNPQIYTTMENKRQIYEYRAEILTKRMLSRIYALEAKALEAKQNMQKEVQRTTENMTWDEYLDRLKKERENLQKQYQELIKASDSKWNAIYEQFSDYTDKLHEMRQDYADLSNDWLKNLNDRISHLEDMARQSGTNVGDFFTNQMGAVKDQVGRIEDKWSDFQNSTGQQWQDFKTGIDQELKTVRTTISNLYGHFRGQKEPDTEAESEK